MCLDHEATFVLKMDLVEFLEFTLPGPKSLARSALLMKSHLGPISYPINPPILAPLQWPRALADLDRTPPYLPSTRAATGRTAQAPVESERWP